MKLNHILLLAILVLLMSSFSFGPSSLYDLKPNVNDTVVIGGKVWMKHNLAIPAPNSFWYENDSLGNSKNGRLYFFSSALAMCPKGWHLPGEREWDELLKTLPADSSNILISLLENGSSGLNLTLAGYRSANSKDDLFGYKGQWGFYWTSTVKAEQTAYARWLNGQNGTISSNFYRRANAFSVRYVRD